MGEIIKQGPWTGFEVISSYTRQQAIEDGVLIDLSSNFPNETRMFKWPVACTSSVWSLIEKAATEDKVEAAVYCWDICYLALVTIRAARKNSGSDCLFFKVHLPLKPGHQPQKLKLVCGPAGPTDSSPCLTIMMPDED